MASGVYLKQWDNSAKNDDFNSLIAANDYNFGAHFTEWPSRFLADKYKNFWKH